MADNVIEIIIKADGSKAVKGLGDVGKSLKDLGIVSKVMEGNFSTLSSSSMAIAGMLGPLGKLAVFVGTASPFVALSKMSMDYETSITRASNVFGDRAGEMIATAEAMSDRFHHYFDGKELLEGLTHMSDMMDTLKVPVESYTLLMERAADIAKAKGYTVQESAEKFEKAIGGSTRGAKEMGVVLTDEFMQFSAFDGKLQEIWPTLNETGKAFYRYKEILIQTEKYQGQASTEATTLKGALKSLMNTIEDRLETQFLGVNKELTKFINLLRHMLELPTVDQKLKDTATRIQELKEKLEIINAGANQPAYEGDVRPFGSMASMRAASARYGFGLGAGEDTGTYRMTNPEYFQSMSLDPARELEGARSEYATLLRALRAEKASAQAERDKRVAEQQFEKPKPGMTNTKTGGAGSGAGPMGIEDIDNQIRSFEKQIRSMYNEMEQGNYDLWAQLAENSGDFYHAEELKTDQWYRGTLGKIAEESLDAQGKLQELEEKTRNARGLTPEAAQAIEVEKSKIQQILSLETDRARQAERYRDAKLRALEISHLGDVQTSRQLNLEYVQLTGSLQDQYEAQVLVVRATLDRNVAEAKTPQIAELYRKIADEQERMARLHANGSMWDGMREGALQAGREIPTAFDRGIEAMETMKRGIDDAAGAFADFAMTGKMDFSTMANSIIRDLIKMELKALMMQSLFGKSGFLAGLFGMFGGGGGTGVSTGSYGVESFAGIGGGYARGGIVSLASDPLRFASGGVVSRPSLAWVGEGRHREAIVPLPDGRAIPARITDQAPQPMQVTVHVTNESSTPVRGEQRSMTRDGENYIIGVVLKDIEEGGPLWHQINGRRGR